METDWNPVLVGIIEFAGLVGALSVIGAIGLKIAKKIFNDNAKSIFDKMNDQHKLVIDAMADLNTQIDSKLAKMVTHYNRVASDHDRRITELESSLQEIDLTCRRNELLMMFHMTPERVDVIRVRYDAYKKRGGNTYIDDLYNEWTTKFAKKRVADVLPIAEAADGVEDIKPKPKTRAKSTPKSKPRTKSTTDEK
jgi:hypothetical protein